MSVCFSVLIYCTSKVSSLPSYNGALTVSAFIISILWICWVCAYVVDMIDLAGIILGIPDYILGMTLLGVGNSLGDLSANRAIARIGLGQTALTACFAGTLFNMLIGFGISLVYSTIDKSI